MIANPRAMLVTLGNRTLDFFRALKEVAKGGIAYYLWVIFLLLIMAAGAIAYSKQWQYGLIVTNMRDQVSWGFYISNFTFLVGVAAAAVLIVIPAYVYEFKPVKEIAFLGEMMAVTVIIMRIMIVTVDLGNPLKAWHLLPIVGTPNWPRSLLTWDVYILTGYLVINLVIFLYVLYKIAHGKSYYGIMPLILLSIPWAISIHTVTAFLYNGLSSRPFWNASVLAPRFLASAFCSGPALMIIVIQAVRGIFKVEINNKAIFKIAELVAYTLAINLFLLGCEIFKEFYSRSISLAPMQYLYFGIGDHTNLVPFAWVSLVSLVIAFLFFVRQKTRENIILLNIGCILIFIGVYIEKGLGLVVSGFIPGPLGEIYEYVPSTVEIVVSLGIYAAGAFIYTLMLKFTIPIYKGKLHL